GDGLNTAGYRWNSPTLAPVDTITARIDYTVNSRHSLFARYNTALRNDLVNDIINTTPRPMSWPARVRNSDQQAGALGLKSGLGPNLLNVANVGLTHKVFEFAHYMYPITY